MFKLILNKLAIVICRSSFFIYKHVYTEVEMKTKSGPLIIPLSQGIGLDNLDFDLKEGWAPILMQEIFKRRNGVFIDIGANIGIMLLCLASVRRDIDYYGFEPQIMACAYIKKLIRANKFSRHWVFPLGFAAKNGFVSLYANDDFDVSASVMPENRGEWTYQESNRIAVFRGDYLVERVVKGDIAVIKIDVEGAELDVLQGLAETLQAYHPVLLFEVLPYAHLDQAYFDAHRGKSNFADQIAVRERRRNSAAMLTVYLTTHGYQFGHVDQRSGHIIWKSTLDPGTSRDRYAVNYVAVHESDATLIEYLSEL